MASAPETQYEPVDLIRRTELVMRAGLLMLGAGTSSLRVDEVMRAVGRSLDLDTVSARISFNDIGLTTSKDGIYRTQVAQVPGPGVNADRIAAMQELVRDLPVPSAPDEVARRLGAIARRRPAPFGALIAVLSDGTELRVGRTYGPSVRARLLKP